MQTREENPPHPLNIQQDHSGFQTKLFIETVWTKRCCTGKTGKSKRSRPASIWTAWKQKLPPSHLTGFSPWTAPLPKVGPFHKAQREPKMNRISAAADRLQFTWTAASSFSFCASAWKKKELISPLLSMLRAIKGEQYSERVHTCACASSSTGGGKGKKKKVY